jgi:hypothetical protein
VFPMPSIRENLAMLGVSACLAALVGCAARGNERQVLGADAPGRGVVLPDIAAVQDRPEARLGDDAPSVTGLDRSGWQASRILVPVEGVHGYPSYAKEINWTRQTRRQRGGPASIASAFEGEGDTFWLRYQEAAAAPFFAIYDLLAAPVRAAYGYPWTEVRHEPRPYWRATPGVAVTVDEPPRGEGSP